MNKISQPLFRTLTACILCLLSLAACTGKVSPAPPLENANKVTIQILGEGFVGCEGAVNYSRRYILLKTPTQFEGTVNFSFTKWESQENISIDKPITIPLDIMTSFIEIIKEADLEVGEFLMATCDPSMTYSIEFQLGKNTIKYISDCADGPWAVLWSEKDDVKYHVEPNEPYQAVDIIKPYLDKVGQLNFETCTIEP
jgi:hypothetical protein